MKRPRSPHPEGPKGDFSFYVYNHQDKHAASFETLRFGKDQDYYVLKFFRPGLQQPNLYTFYILKNEKECIYSTQLQSTDPPGDVVTLMDRCYKVYETYTLGQNTEGIGITYALYFSIDHTAGKIRTDMSLAWLPLHLPRFVRNIQFFPYDVDPTQYGLKLDTTKIPQRTPLWFKVRGDVSGTKAYQLLGFWVPTKEEDPNWTLDGDHVFDEKSKANMRFGSESEDKALIMYATHCKNISSIRLAGWCNAPRPDFPIGWGASPDGLVIDDTHGWNNVPEDIKKYVVSPDDWNPSEGVLEIKSSKRKLSMDAYFFPQVYMEMISTGRVWCDLVRYIPNKIRVYRIYRHKPTEDTLISLWKYARKNVHRLRDVIQEEAFVKIRDYFKRLGAVVSFVEFNATPSIQKEIQSYEMYQKETASNGGGGDCNFLISTKKSKTSQWFEQADANHKAFYGVVNDPDKLKQLILKQIDIYTSVLKGL